MNVSVGIMSEREREDLLNWSDGEKKVYVVVASEQIFKKIINFLHEQEEKEEVSVKVTSKQAFRNLIDPKDWETDGVTEDEILSKICEVGAVGPLEVKGFFEALGIDEDTP